MSSPSPPLRRNSTGSRRQIGRRDTTISKLQMSSSRLRLRAPPKPPAGNAPRAGPANEIEEQARKDAGILVEIDLLRPPSRGIREFPIAVGGCSRHDHKGDEGERSPAGHHAQDEGDGAEDL